MDGANGTASSSSTATTNSKFSLENILSDEHESVEHPKAADGWEEEIPEKAPVEGYCIECEDQPAELLCVSCGSDPYCGVCWASQHRKGSRKTHTVKKFTSKAETQPDAPPSPSKAAQMDVDADSDDDEDWERVTTASAPVVLSAQPVVGEKFGDWFLERSKFIPLRLTLTERKYLRLLEAALSVSEYTDKIDTLGFGQSKAKRIVHQIRELCAIMSGLVLSADYKQGQELFQDRDFAANDEFYQTIFELGRRHKIMNPDKMRTTYGKLIYLLQDSQTPEVKELLSFSCVKPIRTVYTVLEEAGALDLLREEIIVVATKEIYSEGRPRRDVQKDIKSKERAIETLSARYERKGLSQENIRQCLYSIGDNHSFLRRISNLAIRSGKGGARLSHDHSKQYAYVLQSLTLWREILHDMFHLWSLAEQDLLSESIGYRLRDTGQGLNRAQRSVGTWIGSSVIHMGDHNVPNALLFIDKYTQIYRILLPI
ncbi:hypothetical protein BDZ89DRAFT_1071382, partial [Hymenopellis radicata]